MANQVEQILTFISREEEEQRTAALAKQLGLPYINLVSYPILPDLLRLVPQDVVASYHVVPYLKVKNRLRVATSRPGQPHLQKILTLLADQTHLALELVLCSESSIRYVAKLYESLPAQGETQEKVKVEAGGQPLAQVIKNLADLKARLSRAPTTELLDTIFAGAAATNASDIHIEPEEEQARIRYRIDGVLNDVAALPLVAYKALESRIKYLAKLKLDIKNKPQDGRFSAEASGQPIDIRVSLVPGPTGEFIVLRLLYHTQALLELDELGLRPDALAAIREAIKKPHGIIFNTGPTGSGKTTTLYAVLGELNKPGVKIVTLEDPIEYRISGIDQSQVEPEKGYDFANGLRSVLRQDPDIILVGEIRDADTASTAVHAALTGHLVLTTLHTNSASGALPRLIDMGVPPYLLAGAINLIIAQRLVRRLCPSCRGTGVPKLHPRGVTPGVCGICEGQRYKGRLAIVEVLIPNDEINQLIIKKAPLVAFEEAAKRSGMMTMEEDGLEKVAKGLTTKDEIERVTRA